MVEEKQVISEQVEIDSTPTEMASKPLEIVPETIEAMRRDTAEAADAVKKAIHHVAEETPLEVRSTVILSELKPESLAIEVNRTIEPPLIPESSPSPVQPPWTLEQFFNGEIDLDLELSKRYPSMPMMAQVQTRTLGSTSGRRVFTLTTQDGSASLILDADLKTKIVQLSFTLGSMLTLRFTLDTLSDMDKTRWMELMRREQGGLAFLWGQNRWESDYLICISRKHHTNFFAFSPHNFDAGIRLTPPMTKQLLMWLEDVWKSDAPPKEDSAPLLTW